MRTTKVKSVETPRYEIMLLQSEHSGLYYLEYRKKTVKETTMSEGIKDLNTALYAYEVKRLEYEGH